jgi:hypothetical protein
LFSQAVIFELIPHLLIGIEFGRFLGQEEYPQLGPMSANEITDPLGLMKGV